VPSDAQGFEIEPGLTQHYDVLKEMGDCYAALTQYGRARACYNEAAAIAPEEAGPYVGLGVLEIQEGHLDIAAKAFEQAAVLDVNCAEAYGGLAMIAQQSGNHAQAFDLYLKCLQFNSDNLIALLGLFQTSCQMGTFGKIIHFLELYLDKHPGDTSVLFCLATLYARDGKLEQARHLLQTVLALEPGKAEAIHLLKEVQRKCNTIRDIVNI
jgi:tetratricopeptide (TPR) repeat protein